MFLSSENIDNSCDKDANLKGDELKSISECIFCNKNLTSKNEFNASKLLQCLHAICYNCYINWNENIDKQCSVCSFYSKKKDITENKILAEMVTDEEEDSKIGNPVCTIHDFPVTHWCSDCSELICEACVKQHGQLKSTQNHFIKSRVEYLKEKEVPHKSVMPCDIHPQNELTIVCHTCKKLTCRDCQLEAHKDHKYDFISDQVASAKTELFDIFRKVEYSSVVLHSALKKISEREEKLEDIKKSLVSDIKKEFDMIQELLKKRCEDLMLLAIDKANMKLEDCEVNKKVIKKNLDLIKHCLKFVKLVLYNSSDAVLYYTKDLILTHLKRLSITQSIPNPVDVINLKFFSDNVDEAKKKIAICGAIRESDDIVSVDKKYLFAVYTTLMSIYEASNNGSINSKGFKDPKNFPETSSNEPVNTVPISTTQQSKNYMYKQPSLTDEGNSKHLRYQGPQQGIAPQQWHIPETTPIPEKSVSVEDSPQIGLNIKKVRLQLHHENVPSNSKLINNQSSADVEVIDEIMSVLNEMESREQCSAGTDTSPETVSSSDFQNESWCSVCLKGGDVVCCENCPKVFHQACHIPQIILPSKNLLYPVKNIGWRCLLCQDIQPLYRGSNMTHHDKLRKELLIANRLLLELYCQVEASLPFRFGSRNTPSHHKTHPICLNDIKSNIAAGKYSDISLFVKDVRYMFECCFHYEQQDYTKIANARSLQEIFNRLLLQFVPCSK